MVKVLTGVKEVDHQKSESCCRKKMGKKLTAGQKKLPKRLQKAIMKKKKKK